MVASQYGFNEVHVHACGTRLVSDISAVILRLPASSAKWCTLLLLVYIHLLDIEPPSHVE